MAEYIGFTAPDSQPDYGEFTKGLVESLRGIQDKRDTARSEMEQMTSDINSQINSYESGKSKSMNDIMLDAAMSVKENIYNANKLLKSGQIKPSEYRSMINNTKDYWSTLSTTAKNFDQRYQDIIARQDSGEGSKIEADLAEYYAGIADLKNSTIHHDNSTGKIFYAKKDDAGNITRLDDVRRMNNPGNTLFDRVDLSKSVSEVTKNVEDWKIFTDLGMGGSKTITDARQNPSFKNWLANTASGFVSNDRQAASILADNAVQLDNGMTVSFNTYLDDGTNGEARKQAKIDDAVSRFKLAFPDASKEDLNNFIDQQDKSMIRMVQDASGDWQPDLTDEQRKLAYDRVVMEIEMQLPFEQDGTSKQSYNEYYGISTSGSSGSGDEEGGGDYARYAEAEKGWRTGDMSVLSNSFLDRSYYADMVKDKNGIRTIRIRKRSDEIGVDDQIIESFPYSGGSERGDLRRLAPYMYKFGTVKGKEVSPFEQFDRQRDSFKGRNTNSTPNTTVPNTSQYNTNG